MWYSYTRLQEITSEKHWGKKKKERKNWKIVPRPPRWWGSVPRGGSRRRKGSGRLDDGGDVGHRSRFSSSVAAPCSSRRHEIRRSEELTGGCGSSIQRVTSANVASFPDLCRSIVDHGLPTPSSQSESRPLRPGLWRDSWFGRCPSCGTKVGGGIAGKLANKKNTQIPS